MKYKILLKMKNSGSAILTYIYSDITPHEINVTYFQRKLQCCSLSNPNYHTYVASQN